MCTCFEIRVWVRVDRREFDRLRSRFEALCPNGVDLGPCDRVPTSFRDPIPVLDRRESPAGTRGRRENLEIDN